MKLMQLAKAEIGPSSTVDDLPKPTCPYCGKELCTYIGNYICAGNNPPPSIFQTKKIEWKGVWHGWIEDYQVKWIASS